MLPEPPYVIPHPLDDTLSDEPFSDEDAAKAHQIGFLARFAPDLTARPPADAAERAERALVFHGASLKLIERMLSSGKIVDDAAQLLSSELSRLLKFSTLSEEEDTRIMLVGAPAAGKSSMIAKLAAAARGEPPAVFSTDIVRPGGMMRLSEYLSALDIEPRPIDRSNPSFAAPVALNGAILIDTAGVDAGDHAALDELSELAKAVSAEVILVVSALSDPGEARDLADVARALGAYRFLVTRLDMARRLGTVLAAAEAGLALCQGSVTANFAYGLMPLTPVLLADRLLALAEMPPDGS